MPPGALVGRGKWQGGVPGTVICQAWTWKPSLCPLLLKLCPTPRRAAVGGGGEPWVFLQGRVGSPALHITEKGMAAVRFLLPLDALPRLSLQGPSSSSSSSPSVRGHHPQFNFS